VARVLEFHPEAEDEFFAAIDTYEAARPGLGAAFLGAVYEATERVMERPLAGSPVGAELRRVFVRRFPYFVLYESDASRVWVVAVAHFRRRPGYWRDRR
jgi:plasmid stabilization system protein ParE